MAAHDTERPLLSGPLEPGSRTKQNGSNKKRRYRRSKSAPLAEAVPSGADFPCSRVQRWDTIFGSIHPSFKTVAIYLSLYLGIGTISFYLVKNQIEGQKTNGVLDAVYFCVVTMTTVGYGDLVPGTVLTKLLACAFVFSGMALVGLILIKAADYLVEKQEILLVKAIHSHEKLGPSEILKDIEIHRAKYKCITIMFLLAVLIVSGTVFLYVVEKRDFVDAFYCVCSTITTLGYGDQSFSTISGRVFAVFWIITSTICLAQFFFYVAELNTENRQRALTKWVLCRRMTNVDLEAADLDEDGVVSAAEFVIYKLKEMGKITQEDVSLVLKEFDDLDVDQSGTLSVSDLTLAQSSPDEN
ncbi:hypothetical protein CDL15_Pgr007394 [Punica granatum]|uniref:Two-pore potassium channel 1-like n=1 Tax=Punica granatum TaxID=22663 RepID=A0A218X9J5_PUNGR|nr:hypothetical protein CDL15_Pgr007394 [Punica granatum]